MKKILLMMAMFLSLGTVAQYEDEIRMLHTACSTSEENIDKLFESFTSRYEDSLYVYLDNKYNMYIIEYSGSTVVASYVEPYSKKRLRIMNNSIREITDYSSKMEDCMFYENNEYYYLVSNFKDGDNTILITVTPNSL